MKMLHRSAILKWQYSTPATEFFFLLFKVYCAVLFDSPSFHTFTCHRSGIRSATGQAKPPRLFLPKALPDIQTNWEISSLLHVLGLPCSFLPVSHAWYTPKERPEPPHLAPLSVKEQRLTGLVTLSQRVRPASLQRNGLRL